MSERTPPRPLTLCSNCLETGGQPRDIGPTKGNQRDSYRETITLCAVCWEALYGGDLAGFARRYSETRQVTR